MSATNRKQAQEFIITWIDKIAPGGSNKAIYEKLFSAMDDEQFATYIADLESGKKFLVVTAPNLGADNISHERNLTLAKELGHNFFERIWIGAKGDVPAYLTPVQYLVCDLPIRRASQILIKKISIQETSKNADILTGQHVGHPKGAGLSFPELQVLASMGMDNCVEELIKYRGGDVKGYAAMNAMIGRHGVANLDSLANFASGVESVKTLKTLLTAAHLKSTL